MLELNDGATVKLRPSSLRWIELKDNDPKDMTLVKLPVYLDDTRQEVLFIVEVAARADVNVIVKRAVAMLI
jgi:hypothetical protein